MDTGGTFTDFVVFDEIGLRVHKVLSTPRAPERAILQGLRDLGIDRNALHIVHGTTVATNAALEGKGVRTLYIGNRGLGDLLAIGRQARGKLYDLQPKPVDPPVPAELCLETGGRLGADGAVLEPLTEEDLGSIRDAIRRLAPEAVAINLLYSYLDPRFELEIEEIVSPGVFVSRSSKVLPEIREYERGMATWLNAWIGPLVEGYLRRLADAVPNARIAVMQSSGDTILAAQAAGHAVRMLLSGPAGGLVGARRMGEAAERRQLLSFDMGGTSTDVALIDGEPLLTNEGCIGRYPVAVPMVDMHTIGAGGGSVAFLDKGGMLQVGPESAGADPGPACYGKGGRKPTVSDANLILGRLLEDEFLGGRMRLDAGAARAAMVPLADSMCCAPEEAALGIVRVVNENMGQALRVISVQRGIDPRAFTLVSFGGAGGLHVCSLAESLGVSRALVPTHSGVLSALGMLSTRPGRQLSRTHLGVIADLDKEEVERLFAELEDQGFTSLLGEGAERHQLRSRRSVDLRYLGQSYTLSVGWSSPDDAAREFSRLHESRYGHRLEVPVELVNLRVAVSATNQGIDIPALGRQEPASPKSYRPVFGIDASVPVWRRSDLSPGALVHGPSLVVEEVATTWLAPGWSAEVDTVGNLRLDRDPC